MAVNTQKLLSPSKTGTLAVRATKKTISSNKKGGALAINEKGVLAKEILEMKKKVLRLQGIVDKNNKANQNEQIDKVRNREKEERTKREKKLETKDGKGLNLPSVISKLPGGSIIDTIKRFLGFTFLGWLVGQYEKIMPKLEQFMSLTKPVFTGLVSLTTTLFSGIYGFIETGYKVYDGVSAGIKAIGGEGAEKTFHEFSGHLNKLLNGALMVAMLAASTRPRNTPSGAGAGAPLTKVKPKPTGGFGAGTSMTPGRYRPPGQARASGFSLEQARKTATQTSLTKTPPKAGKFAKFSGGRIPVIGPLLTFVIRTAVYGERPEKAAAAAIGTGLGQVIGGALGTAATGGIGFFTAGIGLTLAPFIIGASSLVGGLVGEWIGASLYDFVAGFGGKNKKVGKARGGRISSRGGGRRTKVATSSPQRTKVKAQQTQPGKDIGGKHKIENFYGVERIDPNDSNDKRTRGEVIVKQLEKTSKEIKKLPLDWIASIGGAFVDMTMGQKPDKKLASDVAKSFGAFVDTVVNNEISATTEQITKSLFGMANGGAIPQSNNGELGKKIEKNIEQRLQTIFDEASNITMRNIKSESLMKQAEELRDMQRRSQERQGGGGGGTDIEKIEMGDFSAEDIDVLGRMIAAESGNQTGLGKAGVLSVILNRYRLAKSGDMGYMPSGKNKNTVTLKDIIYDKGQFTPITDGRFDRTTSDAGKNALAAAIAASGNDPQKFKQKLMSELNMSESDAETVVRATAFSNPKSRSRKPFDTKEVSVGNHSFQESPYSRIGSFPGAISARVTRLPIGNIPKADYVKGVFDESGEPGFDVTWKGDNNVAILPGTIKEVGQLYGSGYGNVVVVESVDPVTGKKVDVLYAHFPNGGISVRPGDVVRTGQVLGRMGKPGEPGIGNITGQHASIDFYEPGSRNKYSNWQRLASEIIKASQTGRNPSTWPKPKPPPKPANKNGRPSTVEQLRRLGISTKSGIVLPPSTPKKPVYRPAGGGMGGARDSRGSKPNTPNMKRGGVVGTYSSLNSLKEDTSLSSEVVVMYQERYIVPA